MKKHEVADFLGIVAYSCWAIWVTWEYVPAGWRSYVLHGASFAAITAVLMVIKALTKRDIDY